MLRKILRLHLGSVGMRTDYRSYTVCLEKGTGQGRCLCTHLAFQLVKRVLTEELRWCGLREVIHYPQSQFPDL